MKTVWLWYWPQVSTPLSIGKLLPRWLSGKESACQCRRHKSLGFDPWVGKIPWRRKWQCAPVFLSGKFHGQKSLAGYSPRGWNESDMTEHARARTHTHTHTHTHTCWETWVTLSFPSSSSVMSPLLFLALHWTPLDGQLLVFWLKKKEKEKMAAKPSSIQELLLQILTLKHNFHKLDTYYHW